MDPYLFKTYTTVADAADAFTLRHEIFVKEQGIPAHLDVDPDDPESYHLVVYANDNPVGTGRITLQPDRAVLSRIAVATSERGNGLGVQIVGRLEKIAIDKGIKTFTLRPHDYLEKFYKSQGYIKTRDNIKIEGINLLEMQKVI